MEKQVSLYYLINDSENLIYILRLTDNRRNPKLIAQDIINTI